MITRNLKLFCALFFLAASASASVTINGRCYDLLWNPFTGTNQYVSCGPVITSAQVGDCVFWNGTNFYLGTCTGGGGGGGPFILLEDSTFALLEDGGKIIQE